MITMSLLAFVMLVMCMLFEWRLIAIITFATFFLVGEISIRDVPPRGSGIPHAYDAPFRSQDP
jgi:hypothetical protein